MRESVRLCKCDKKKCKKKKSKEQKSVRNNACGAKLLGAGLRYRSVADRDKFLTDTTATTRAKRGKELLGPPK